MILDISPTRMELLRLKKRLSIAIRGHKLLKNKLDELIRIMLALVKDTLELRKKTDDKFAEANRYMAVAGSSTSTEILNAALMVSERRIKIDLKYRQIFNIKVPEFSAQSIKGSGSYGFAQTSAGLDFALEIFDKTVKQLIELSEKEKKVQLIGDEIQKTRRRVNALEYILIPNIKETLKYITMKLEERERDNQTQLMRVKDVVRAPMAPTSAYPGSLKYPL